MTFYRSKITLTVLSDRRIDGLELGEIMYQCDEGDMVLGAVDQTTEELTRAEIDVALTEAGSDPGFFPEEGQ